MSTLSSASFSGGTLFAAKDTNRRELKVKKGILNVKITEEAKEIFRLRNAFSAYLDRDGSMLRNHDPGKLNFFPAYP